MASRLSSSIVMCMARDRDECLAGDTASRLEPGCLMPLPVPARQCRLGSAQPMPWTGRVVRLSRRCYSGPLACGHDAKYVSTNSRDSIDARRHFAGTPLFFGRSPGS